VEEALNKSKMEGIKKILLRGKATIQEIAEDMDVSIEFVKKVQKTLAVPASKIRKQRVKKNTTL
jgi:predicted transcriptional regulator